ncbi:MAG TPA: hypothetical protein DCP07_04020 [Lachnospiraceae bacterium]|nr:hypothetical protein [Lachnospiraceae bacterium]
MKLFGLGLYTKEVAEEAYANELNYIRNRYAVLTVADLNEEQWAAANWSEDYRDSYYDRYYDIEDEAADSSIGWDFEMLSNLEQIKYIFGDKVVYNYLLPEPRKLTEDEIRANKRKKLQNEIDALEASIKSQELELKELKDELNNL